MYLAAMLIAASPVAPPCAQGTWALKASGTTVFRFTIGTTATWERPDHFETDGDSFSKVSGPPIWRVATNVKLRDGEVEVTFADPIPGALPDIFRFHCVDKSHLTASYEGSAFEPFDLVKDQPNGGPLGPWDRRRTYVCAVKRPTNAKMTAIFEADQAERRTDQIDWSIVEPADQKRLHDTQELLEAGALQSGDDFYHAAFVFQHGSRPGDYLKAHLLATVAIARGKPGAVWIAAASLDRYLQAIGQPQVLGTQYKVPKSGTATQEPYDRALMPDALRRALHVPGLSEQEQR